MDIQNTNEASNKLFKDEQDKNHKATLEKLTEIVRAAQKAMRDEELDQLRAQLAAQAEQIKVAREAIVTLRKFVGDPSNFDCYGTEEELSGFLQRVRRDEDAAIKQADEALAKIGEQ